MQSVASAAAVAAIVAAASKVAVLMSWLLDHCLTVDLDDFALADLIFGVGIELSAAHFVDHELADIAAFQNL